MNETFVDIVYGLLNGTRIRQPGDPEVENLFAIGRECERLYDQVYSANLRLCDRLQSGDEDRDVEVIINSMLEICDIVGKRMYRYGMEFGHE